MTNPEQTGRQSDEFSIIAEMVFVAKPQINFARLVGDLDAVLARFQGPDRHLTWDCEDVAIFDMPGIRIALACNEEPQSGVATSLMISVGPTPLPTKLNEKKPLHRKGVSYEEMCSKLVERVQSRLSPDAVFWHECAAPVTADLIDELSSALPELTHRPDPKHPIFASVDGSNVDEIYARGFDTANDRPHLPLPRNPELARVRSALYPPEMQAAAVQLEVSPQLRLAAHTMNVTLIMVALPVGAAMMTYSVLRGENMRLSTAAMVATGFATTLIQSPIGQTMLHFAAS
jgi:hypothetical protein